MRIGELALATGIDVETIRYYEKIGLLQAPSRQANGYRAYQAHHTEQLIFIRNCRALDMPLSHVRHLLDFIARPNADCGDINHLIDEHINHVRARLASMQALERQLVALRARCGESHPARECGILHELVTTTQVEHPKRSR